MEPLCFCAYVLVHSISHHERNYYLIDITLKLCLSFFGSLPDPSISPELSLLVSEE